MTTGLQTMIQDPSQSSTPLLPIELYYDNGTLFVEVSNVRGRDLLRVRNLNGDLEDGFASCDTEYSETCSNIDTPCFEFEGSSRDRGVLTLFNGRAMVRRHLECREEGYVGTQRLELMDGRFLLLDRSPMYSYIATSRTGVDNYYLGACLYRGLEALNPSRFRSDAISFFQGFGTWGGCQTLDEISSVARALEVSRKQVRATYIRHGARLATRENLLTPPDRRMCR